MSDTNLLGELLVKIKGDLSDLEKSLKEAEKSSKTTGNKITESLKKQFKEVDSVLGGVGSKMIKLLKNPIVLATTAIVGLGKGFFDATKDLVAYSSEIDDMAMRTGLSSDALQEWKYIAEQTGTSLEAVTTSVGAMTRGLETNKDEYERLGIATKNSNGTFRTTSEIFNDTIATLSEMTDETERDQLAFKLLGRSAQSLLPIFNNGAAAISGIRNEAHSLGLVLKSDTIKNADALGDAMGGLNSSVKSAARTFVSDMTPALLAIVTGLNNTIKRTNDAKLEWESYRKALKGETLDQAGLSAAIKKTSEETERLKKMLTGTYRNEEDKKAIQERIDASKALESSLRAEAKALASGQEANRLGTKYAKDKAEADRQAAEAAKEKADKAEEAAAKQKKADDEAAARLKKLTDLEVEARKVSDEINAERDRHDEKKAAAHKARLEEIKAEETAVKEFGDLQKSSTDLEIKSINERRDAFIKAGVDEVAANKWAQQQILSTYLNVGKTILSAMQGIFSSLQSLYQQDTRNKLDSINAKLNADLEALNKQMEAELETAGLLEATTLEKLQRELTAAIAAGDTETAEKLQDEIDREIIKQKYADLELDKKKKAALKTYEIEKAAFKANQNFSIAQALISSAQGAIDAYKALAGIPVVGPGLGILAAAAFAAYAAEQVSAIKSQVPPSPPALAQGGEVGANKPTLAVIGDNTRYNEVVAPLSPDTFAKIADGILVALSSRARPAGYTENTEGASSTYNGSSGSGVTVNAGVIVANDAGLRAFARVISPYLKAETVRIG